MMIRMSKETVNNSTVVLDRLMQLYRYGELCDIKLVVGHQEFSTHKLVLCMSSDVFRTMLTGRTWPEAHSKRIVLQEDPQCVAVFEKFLRYLYNGQVELQVFNVLLLLTLADKYNIADLSESCLLYMRTHCDPEAVEYIPSWQQYAVLCGYTELEDKCHTYIKNNFESIMRTREFKNFSKGLLLSYLDSSDLVISGEYTLYKAVLRWVKSNQARDPLSPDYLSSTSTQLQDYSLFEEVMSHVRFPMIPLAQLGELEADPAVNLFKEFYLSQIFQAIKYHTSPQQVRQQLIESSPDCNLFKPRNYCCESWSTMIEVDNLSNILPGEIQGAFFTTPQSCSEYDRHNLCDWLVDLYPKGVKFDPCIMISVPNNLRVNGTFDKNIRLSVAPNCKKGQDLNNFHQRFEVSLVIKSSKVDGREHVCKVLSERPLFDEKYPWFNFNHIVPYEELNSLNSPYTVGKDKMKVVIIVKPDGP